MIVRDKKQDDEVELTAEELAELDAAIEEADRDGGGIPAEEFLRELRTKYGHH